MTEPEETTTIRLKRSTVDRLDKWGIFGESYDALVTRLLDKVSKFEKARE